MSLEKEFIPYEESLELKELGFDGLCFAYYENQDKKLIIYFHNRPLTEEQQKRPGLYKIDNRNFILPQWATAAPTFSQAFRWFREKYSDLDFGVSKIHNGTNNYHYHINLTWEFFEGTYEEAELTCLKKLIEIVKK